MNNVILGIGTNIGDRERNLKEAISAIKANIGNILRSSSVYETEPWGFNAEVQFLNMVIETETKLSASGVLGAILMIEAMLGRMRGEKQYSSREMDIDILLYGDEIINEESLKIPHPRMHERRFVLVPLCEIIPDRVHPVKKIPFKLLLDTCTDTGIVKKYI